MGISDAYIVACRCNVCDDAAVKLPPAQCDQPILRRAWDDYPPARAKTLNREPLADQEKAVMRRDSNGCMVPVKVREDVGDAQQR
jgi:hypothetical protein